MILNILLTLFLVFLNGFFVAAEFAIVKVRMSQIELHARSGNFIAIIARHILTQLDAYLSATQLGITIASLGLGWIGEKVVAEIILGFMGVVGIQILPETAHTISVPLAFGLITVMHIVFGELVPKSLAIQRAERVTLIVALPMRGFYLLFKPFIWALNGFANVVLKQLRIMPAHEQELHSSDEIRYLLEESSKSGMIETAEHELLENVFEFRETTANQIMVPRNRVVALEVSMKGRQIVDKVIEEGYSRMPVYKGGIDNIQGVVYAKDLITMMNHPDLIILHDVLRPAYFVRETEKIHRLLRNMQKQKAHLAVVIDEFGGTAGILTLENIMEELVGDIQDEYDEEAPILKANAENEWLIEASASITEINEFLPFPLPEAEEYETIGGFINRLTGKIPETNEVIRLNEYDCLIVKSTRRRVETVKLQLYSDNKPSDHQAN